MSQQLTSEDRAVLAQLLSTNMPVIEIARRLKKHLSTIYRELARNTCAWGYLPEDAQQRTNIRRWVNHRVRKMDDPAIRKYVCQGLKRYWSPDQIAGRSQLDFRGQPRRQISRQTIYQWINTQPEEERRQWRKCLRFGQPRRKRRARRGPITEGRVDRRATGYRRCTSPLW